MLKVTVVRKKWLHGEPQKGQLLRGGEFGDGKMCCLGFVALAAGMTEKHINGLADIAEALDHEHKEVPGALSELVKPKFDLESNVICGWYNSPVSEALIEANDADPINMDDAERESIICAEGLKANIEFTFVDEDMTCSK